jgi:hypothetical protein
MLHFLHIRSRLFLSFQFWISAHEPDIPQMSNLRDTLTQREEIPLLSAAAYGDLAAVKYLIEEKAVQIDCTNSKEETPLLLACCYGHVEIVDYLLDHRANAALESKLGENPLYHLSSLPSQHIDRIADRLWAGNTPLKHVVLGADMFDTLIMRDEFLCIPSRPCRTLFYKAFLLGPFGYLYGTISKNL